MATATRSRARSVPLDQAVNEYLEWLELDRHRSPRTVTEYRADLDRFLEFAENTEVHRIAALDRELIRAYQRDVNRGRKTTPAGTRPHSVATR